jgi:hypothetical protein
MIGGKIACLRTTGDPQACRHKIEAADREQQPASYNPGRIIACRDASNDRDRSAEASRDLKDFLREIGQDKANRTGLFFEERLTRTAFKSASLVTEPRTNSTPGVFANQSSEGPVNIP